MNTLRTQTGRLGSLVVIFCLPIVLLLSNLYLVATPAFIHYEYAKSGFPQSMFFDPEERIPLAEATLHYLRSGEDAGYLRGLSSEGWNVYNEREIRHLVDVKGVMRAAFGVHGAATLLCIAALGWLCRRRETRALALRSLCGGCVALLLLLAAAGALAYTAWDAFFVFFHRVFFSGDSWLFAYSDTLIQLFPVDFWMDATWALVLPAILESLVLGALAGGALWRQSGLAPAGSTGTDVD